MKDKKKKKFRHSNTFYRRVKKFQKAPELLLKRSPPNNSETAMESPAVTGPSCMPSGVECESINTKEQIDNQPLELLLNNNSNLELHDSSTDPLSEEENDQNNLQRDLREWSLGHNISHIAVTDLLHILRSHGLPLPASSRTILKTPTEVNIIKMGRGEFWYNGIAKPLVSLMENVKDIPPSITLRINVDGLPPFKSAPLEFWPILFQVIEMPDVEPMAAGIYCGDTKPPLAHFLEEFVKEAGIILQNGIILHNGTKIGVALKYFVCDTPARSFIKGTAGFNSFHGCIKCTVVGEYDKGGRHMSFPRIDCPLRTDTSFRNQDEEEHHKEISPLLNLPIDMVDQFIVADSLHLLDLGVMRKCIYAWVNGSYNFKSKLSGAQILSLSKRLEDCNETRPKEIHRSIRNTKSLKFWKGVEFRVLLLYVGPVVFKEFLNVDVYNNLLVLHVAVTILSCSSYMKHIDIADQLLKDYIHQYIQLYGIDSIGSNLHNLCHIVKDVKCFGDLSKISAYPFENFLGKIKRYLRTGSRPLAQISKRTLELENLNTARVDLSKNKTGYILEELTSPNLTLPDGCIGQYKTLLFSTLLKLSACKKDKWFLTKNNQIVAMACVTKCNGQICIFGFPLKDQEDLYDLPIKSSYINIFKSSGALSIPQLYCIDQIKCKLFCVNLAFFPLLHTLEMFEDNHK